MATAKPSTLSRQLDRVREYLEAKPEASAVVQPRIGKLQAAGRFVYLCVRGFNDNRCALRAAALTYTMLLALIPMLAVVLSVSKNFLHDRTADVVPRLIDRAITLVAPQLEYMPVENEARPADKPGQVTISSKARQEMVDRIQTFIGNINAGALGTVGTILLIVVAIQMMMTIEESFNDIWGVVKGRPIWQKVVYYWATLTLGPLLLLLTIGVTGTMQFSRIINQVSVSPLLERPILFLAPFVMLWIGFGLMYKLMPNARVQTRAALIGGIVGGSLWQLNSLLSTLYVSRVVTYSKIYGSIGIIPVFLIGLYFAWYIILFGAQVSFVAQNLRYHLQQQASERVDEEGRERIGCRIVLLACQHFLRGQRAPGFSEVGMRLGVPSPLLNRLVRRLVEGGVISEIAEETRALQPARPPEQITLADVLHVLRTNNGVCGEVSRAAAGDPADHSLDELYLAERSSPANARFSDLAAKLNAPA